MKCDSIATTFTKPPVLSERFASASTYQYFHLSGVDQYIGVHILERLCEGKLFRLHDCKNQIQELENASYIDVDFDAISHALVFTAFWNPNRPQIMPTQRDKRPIKKLDSSDTIEVGVLQSEKANEPEELSMGGYLTLIEEQDRPSMIYFLKLYWCTTNDNRTDTVFLPITPPYSATGTANLLSCLFSTADRPSSQIRDHPPKPRPETTERHLRAPRVLDTSVNPFY